jgi:metal-dependent hydrolase (beta-lactamase superfamily II)
MTDVCIGVGMKKRKYSASVLSRQHRDFYQGLNTIRSEVSRLMAGFTDPQLRIAWQRVPAEGVGDDQMRIEGFYIR